LQLLAGWLWHASAECALVRVGWVDLLVCEVLGLVPDRVRCARRRRDAGVVAEEPQLPAFMGRERCDARVRRAEQLERPNGRCAARERPV